MMLGTPVYWVLTINVMDCCWFKLDLHTSQAFCLESSFLGPQGQGSTVSLSAQRWNRRLFDGSCSYKGGSSLSVSLSQQG